jgi:diketogulonate reductase-like aldo/keto reductase
MDDVNGVREEPNRVLANGVRVPTLGLGVWQMAAGKETEQAVGWALEAGYRHIDTAAAYANEESVGVALRHSGVARDEVFVTTKLMPTRPDAVRELEGSLGRLGLDQVDLYLVHWPVAGKTPGHWESLEQLYEQGLARAIGVSNFGVEDLTQLSVTASIAPHVDQVHCSPWHFPRALVEYCEQQGTAFEGYSPLEQGRALKHGIVADIAGRNGRTAAQVLVRWSLQHDVITIPKSSHRERIDENRHVFDFELDDADMARLDALDETGFGASA